MSASLLGVVAAGALVAVVALGACRVGDPLPSNAPEPRVQLAEQKSPLRPQGTPAIPTEVGIWESRGNGPGTRAGHAMVFDVARTQSLVFGGQTGGIPLGDTWTWDGTAWTQVCNGACAAASPPPRFAHAMAYDSARAVAVLFGGEGLAATGSPLGDTWEWDGTTWTQACTTAACAPPSPRFGHAMAFDATRGKVVLYGGTTCAASAVCTDLGDTWEWDGTAWAEATSAGAPAPGPRAGSAMAFDPSLGVRGKTVLFGGVHLVALGDTWTWDGTGWTEACASCAAPPASAYAALAYDSTRAEVVLFGGTEAPADTWDWDGMAWTELATSASPSARDSLATAYDSVRRRLVLYGGFGGGADLEDTWEEYRYAGACSGDADCETGLCAAGVCCLTACGTCATCAATGTCTPVTNAADPSCAGECDATGRCVKSNGQACTSRDECGSTFCVDGVCCDKSCTDVCDACLGALTTGGKDGVCDAVKAGIDPHDDCADEGACSCGFDGLCDGAGACANYPKQTSCACGNPTRTLFGFQCDGVGSCLAPLPDERACAAESTLGFADGGTLACAPYRCVETPAPGCATSCLSTEDCAPPATCTATHECAAAPAQPSAESAPGCSVRPASVGSAPRGSDRGTLAIVASLSAFVVTRRARRRRASP